MVRYVVRYGGYGTRHGTARYGTRAPGHYVVCHWKPWQAGMRESVGRIPVKKVLNKARVPLNKKP